MRVVLDTNVLVSAVLGGALRTILDRWLEGKFTLVMSDDIMREYHDVLRRPKFGLPDETVTSIAVQIFHDAEFVTPADEIKAIPDDPSDDKFLAAAIEGHADVIVSGDRHLLLLHQ